MNQSGPNIEMIRGFRDSVADRLVRTPVVRCAAVEQRLGGSTRVSGKLELLQRTGTFKARGALATVLSLAPDELLRGVTAFSAGNHAIATAFAAKAAGSSAKVVMTASANPLRVAACRKLGAEVVIAESVHDAFITAQRIEQEEGRYFVHPFEGPKIALGTGGVGLEICEQIDDFDAVVVPVGGGGLIGGVANAIRQLRPAAEIIGVEPEGADSMHRSFANGAAQSIEKMTSIADSLGAPCAMPYSFELTRRNVDRLVKVTDEQLRRGMGFLFQSMRMAVEPACAASTAALLGPLRNSLQGKHVALVYCGSNIDWPTFAAQVVFDAD